MAKKSKNKSKNPPANKATTFSYGSKCVPFILISPKIVENLRTSLITGNRLIDLGKETVRVVNNWKAKGREVFVIDSIDLVRTIENLRIDPSDYDLMRLPTTTMFLLPKFSGYSSCIVTPVTDRIIIRDNGSDYEVDHDILVQTHGQGQSKEFIDTTNTLMGGFSHITTCGAKGIVERIAKEAKLPDPKHIGDKYGAENTSLEHMLFLYKLMIAIQVGLVSTIDGVRPVFKLIKDKKSTVLPTIVTAGEGMDQYFKQGSVQCVRAHVRCLRDDRYRRNDDGSYRWVLVEGHVRGSRKVTSGCETIHTENNKHKEI